MAASTRDRGARSEASARRGGPPASSARNEAGALQEILEAVCREAQGLLGGEGACVNGLAREGRELVVRAATGSLEGHVGARFSIEDSVSGTAVRQGRPCFDNHLARSEVGREARKLDPGISRALAVVLGSPDAPLGTLAVVNGGGEGGFGDEDVRLLSAFAVPAAVAIRAGNDLAEERERASSLASDRDRKRDEVNRLRLLDRASLDLAGELPTDDLLEVIAERARVLTGARYAAVGVLNGEGDGLSRFITAGLSADERARYGLPPAGKGLLEAVIREEESVRVADAREDPRSHGTPASHHEVTSFVGVPITVGGRRFGNLYVTNREEGGEFTRRDEVILEMLAAHAGVALDRAGHVVEREELIRNLERARGHQQRLTSFVSHDVRNALGGVALWAERLVRRLEREDPDRAEVREMTGKILRGSEHALRIVEDVLDLSRLESGHLEVWLRPVVVAEAVSAAVDAVAPRAARQDVRIDVDEIPRAVRAISDPDRVLQIVTNLLSNAVRFSPEGAAVRVEAGARDSGPDGCSQEAEAGCIWIAVEDRGPGIREEEQGRIFGLYDRKEQGGDPVRGSGIGLTISLQLARLMGGTITLESEVGEGSRFTLWLPSEGEPSHRPGWIG